MAEFTTAGVIDHDYDAYIDAHPNEATVRWSEIISEPVHTTTLHLPQQDINKSGQPQYGENLSYIAVKELTAHNAKIGWKVHIANQKSAWDEFQIALDIPEAASAPPSLLRNASVADHKALIFDPGAAHIEGCNARGEALSGVFMERSVYLSELRTDADGRLIVPGGHGKSASHDGSAAVTFANNEGWYDDTSDGPVTASVEYPGVALNVQPAWVITAPPNYAPLSSQGIFNALYTGLAAAESIHRRLRGESHDFAGYCGQIARIEHTYQQHLRHWYGTEHRWPQAPFWQRRQSPGMHLA